MHSLPRHFGSASSSQLMAVRAASADHHHARADRQRQPLSVASGKFDGTACSMAGELTACVSPRWDTCVVASRPMVISTSAGEFRLPDVRRLTRLSSMNTSLTVVPRSRVKAAMVGASRSASPGLY